MQCPTDGAILVMSERSGIEIDYCPTCRGVWLDRGELDKIIERSFTQPQAAAPAPQPSPSPSPQGGYYRKKRKESWLSELFD
jgi:Zn-finger nucleic acid-binding protein